MQDRKDEDEGRVLEEKPQGEIGKSLGKERHWSAGKEG